MNGSDLFLMLDVGTDETPAYQVVGCQRDSTFEEVSETIDFSCKDSRAQAVEPGRYNASLSLDFLFVPTASDYQALKNANRQGDFVILARRESGIIMQRATAKIDSMSENFPDQAESVIALAATVDNIIESVWIIGEGVLGEVFIA